MYEPEEEPSFLSRYTVPLGVVAGLIVMAVAAFFVLGLGGDDGDGGSANNGGDGNPTPAASPTATGGNAQEQAIGAYVRTTLNMEYAGDCSTTVPGQGGPNQTPAAGATVPPVANRICSVKRGDRDGVAGYVLGQPLSEPTRYIFLEQRGGQWQVTYSPAITADTRAVPGIPWPLKPGVEVVVVGTGGECLNVREGPALSQAAVDCIAENTRIKLASGPADSDNRQWWQVDGRSGWVTADYLRYPDAAQ